MSVNQYENVLNSDEISYILNNNTTISSRSLLDTNNVVKFYIELSDSIKNSLKTIIGLDLYNVTDIPMRWIKGDTLPHLDRGTTSKNS